MRLFHLRFRLLGNLALAGLPALAVAQPTGSEFQINTYTTAEQDHPVVASDASGNFIVAWSGEGQGDSFGIFGQRYDSEGGMLGGEFRVNSYTTERQSEPAVSSDASGNFIVVWQSRGQDGVGEGIFGQRYDSGGGTLGSEFRVNSTTFLDQSNPSVSTDAAGNFVVVWDGDTDAYYGYIEVYGQRFNSAGNPLGTEFRINTYTTGFQSGPSVASDASGDFVVVWNNQPDTYFLITSIYGQRFDSGGAPQGTEFPVSSSPPGNQLLPSVASDASGNFVVVWELYYSKVGGLAIYGRRFDSEGGAQGDEFLVNTYTTDLKEGASVASDASGNFVVVWQSYGQDGSSLGIFGQRFDSEGEAQGGEFQVNSYTTLHQQRPSVAATGANQFVVAWDSYPQDGSFSGVFGQRYDFAGAPITVVSPNTNVNWRIGSLKKIMWTHNLGFDATFLIELDRDDDGDYEELIAAAAPVDNATKSSFGWTVTGPPSATARVRVSWTDDLGVSDASDVTFEIRPPG